jgi:hypothetical protein
VLLVDAIYSHVKDSVSLALAAGSNNANGVPIPPFLPQTLTATISDNEAVMLVAKYTNGPLKLYGGYEHIRYMAPSDPRAAFTDIVESFVCLGCDALNNTISTIPPSARTVLVTRRSRSCGSGPNTPLPKISM